MGMTIGSDPIYHEKGELHAPDESGAQIIATRQWVQDNAGGSSILVYTGLWTQSGTSHPSDGNSGNGLQNTLGGALTITRDSVGLYSGTRTGAFTVGKTFIPGFGSTYNGNAAVYLPISDGNGGSVVGYYHIEVVDADLFTVEILDSSFVRAEWSSILAETPLPIEVRVYS